MAANKPKAKGRESNQAVMRFMIAPIAFKCGVLAQCSAGVPAQLRRVARLASPVVQGDQPRSRS